MGIRPEGRRPPALPRLAETIAVDTRTPPISEALKLEYRIYLRDRMDWIDLDQVEGAANEDIGSDDSGSLISACSSSSGT